MTNPWFTLAESYDVFFPLRAPRLEMALAVAPEGSRVLDAGCATGSLVRALAERGRRAEGLDLEPAFLDVARQRAEGLGIAWHQADLRELEAVTSGRFQAILCLGQTLPHLLEDQDWQAFFAQCAVRLEVGGSLFIQATWDGEGQVGASRELPLLQAGESRLERRRTLISERLARFETRLFLPGQEPVTCEVLHRRIHPDLAAEWMRACGLEPEVPWADESAKPFEASSPSWILRGRLN